MDSGRSDRAPEPGPYRFDPAEAAGLGVARARVLERIEHACRRAARNPDEVRLVAVTKTVPVERLRAALGAGLTVFGENRVQEAAEKAAGLPGATWHLIGPLQSNKARRAVEVFASIQTVDGLDLAARLDRLAAELRPGRQLPVLLEVNVDADPAKAGFRPPDLEAGLAGLLELPNLKVDGLMTVGRLVADPEAARPTFVALRRLSEALRATRPGLGPDLSMGMSDDFETAVEEGATIVRVGRAIFGARPGAGADSLVMAAQFAANFLRFFLIALEIAIIGRVLLSYAEPRGRSSAAQFLVMITEPVLGPVRRVLPSSGGLDFSPFLVVIAIGFVVRMLP